MFSLNKSLLRLVLVTAVLLMGALSGCGQTSGDPATAPEPGPQVAQPHGHDHEEDLVEWSGVYALTAGTYTLSFGESVHDPSIIVVFLDQDDYREPGDDLVALHTAQHLMEAASAPVAAGARLEVSDQACYNLTLLPGGTTYRLDVPETGVYIMFTEHFAWEFDMQITGEDGRAVEPAETREYSEPHAH